MLPVLIEHPDTGGQSTKANNSKTLAYELGARDSVTIFAGQELLIVHAVEHVQVVDSRSAGAIAIRSDGIRNLWERDTAQTFLEELFVSSKQRVSIFLSLYVLKDVSLSKDSKCTGSISDSRSA